MFKGNSLLSLETCIGVVVPPPPRVYSLPAEFTPLPFASARKMPLLVGRVSLPPLTSLIKIPNHFILPNNESKLVPLLFLPGFPAARRFLHGRDILRRTAHPRRPTSPTFLSQREPVKKRRRMRCFHSPRSSAPRFKGKPKEPNSSGFACAAAGFRRVGRGIPADQLQKSGCCLQKVQSAWWETAGLTAVRLSSRPAGHHKEEDDEKAPSLKKKNVAPNARAWSLSTYPPCDRELVWSSHCC